MSRVVSILLRQPKRGSVQVVDRAEAIVGKGLDGDRYAEKLSHTSWARANREVTLVEREALEAARAETGIDLSHEQLRRNLLTEGVRLNDLLGADFRVGPDVVLRGMQLCHPCTHLEQTTVPGALKAFAGRGGLRAKVVIGGAIQVGDVIEPPRTLFDGPAPSREAGK